MAKSKIEWTDRVWNPVTGCTPISPGCENCYAERMTKRFAETWGLPADDPFKVTLHPERLEQPLRWTKPSKVFVCSMADLFHDDVPFNFFKDVMDVIRVCTDQTFLILTKRPERMKKMFNVLQGAPCEQTAVDEIQSWWSEFLPLPNVWLGVTAENQEQADKRIPILLQIPAAVRFVSVEPMLGPVNLDKIEALCYTWRRGATIGTYLDWVICGGESGPGARPMHPDWARSLRDQCQAAGVPFFFKQWGEWGNLRQGLINGNGKVIFKRVGKKKAGCLLEGQEWKQFPVCCN